MKNNWRDKINVKAFPSWQKSCLMPSRKCNITCRGCGVIAKQCQYELTTEEWKKALDIQKAYGVGFVVWFGGEPTLREDLPKLISYCNEISLPHTIITNSIRLLRDEPYYKRLIESKPFGLSVSFNGISHGKAKHGDEIKSEAGYKLIQRIKKDLPKCDLVANMAVTRENIRDLPKTVQLLTDNNIWVIMTFIHLCKPHESIYWYYRGPEDNSNIKLKLTEEDIPIIRKIRDWFKENYDNLLLHNSKQYFDLWDNLCLTQDWKCSKFTNPNINPDGQIMACIDRPLDEPFNILDLPGREKEFQEIFDRAIKYCYGCLWNHMRETNVYALQGEAEKAKLIFAHKHKKL